MAGLSPRFARRYVTDTASDGGLLLVQTVPSTVSHLTDTKDLVVVEEDSFDRLHEDDIDELAPLSPKTPLTVAIMTGVVGTAALGVASIVIAALAGVFCMVVAGCLSTSEAYNAVSWNVVFLLAGVIPLGTALEATGGSQAIAAMLVSTAEFLPLVAVLLLFYRRFKASARGLDPVGEADNGRPAAGLSLPAHRPTVSKRLIRANQNKSV